MRPLDFRGRLFLFLLSFAVVPAIAVSLVWAGAVGWSLNRTGSSAAWERVAASGTSAIAEARRAPLDAAGRAALAEHETQLNNSARLSRQAAYVLPRMAGVVIVLSVLAVGVFIFLASNVAGHLSRALSRPLQELVGWTELIASGRALPEGPPRRGAPEFELLRTRMRRMAGELELGRARALEAERAAALRESARQVAHELKNPLTPIRFAVDRLRREVPPSLSETVDVLAAEASRLEVMARSFAQFGRLPEGPRAAVDVADLARTTARTVVPPEIPVAFDIGDAIPLVHGHYDALARALTNVMLNAVDACGHTASANGNGSPAGDASLTVTVAPATLRGQPAVALVIRDTGCGIEPSSLRSIWEPYVTSKPGGTGLGLAIVRQTVLAHDGEVGAESEPGIGTAIRVVLPARPDPHTDTHVSRPS
jgi:two-component system nitrogen regulation sensor histidine kinase NtrY